MFSVLLVFITLTYVHIFTLAFAPNEQKKNPPLFHLMSEMMNVRQKKNDEFPLFHLTLDK